MMQYVKNIDMKYVTSNFLPLKLQAVIENIRNADNWGHETKKTIKALPYQCKYSEFKSLKSQL